MLRSQYEDQECLVMALMGSVSMGPSAIPNRSDHGVRRTVLGRSCPKMTRQSWKSGDVTKSLGMGGVINAFGDGWWFVGVWWKGGCGGKVGG